MYDSRQNLQYGWQQNSPRSSDMIELPTTTVRRRANGPGGCCGGMNWYTFGILLSLLAAASLALGVADIVITYKTYVDGQQCSTYTTPNYCDPNNLVWTWVAVGIWGSLPVFIFGVFAICKGSRPMHQFHYFDLLAFLCAFVFSPAIIVLSAIEVYKGSSIYYWTAKYLTQDDLVKAIIPIVIAGLGLIEFLMCLSSFFDLCCCTPNAGSLYGGGAMDKTILRSPQQFNGYAQGTYDRPYNSQPVNQVASSFFSAQAPPRISSSYNQYNTGPIACNGFKQCSAPNPAYSYFRS